MAKIIEEVIIVKLSRMAKDSDTLSSVVDDKQKKLIEQTIPALIEEVIGDSAVIVEIAEID